MSDFKAERNSRSPRGRANMSRKGSYDAPDKALAAPPKGEKLQKVLARLGLASRREIETWIADGRVKVNGSTAGLAQRVGRSDAISVDGRPIKEEHAQAVRRVLIYNKPLGEVCSRSDPEGRPSVFQRLPHLKSGRWINVGRLDITTTGLLLFTTDGELANRLMHPSYQMDREYAVRVRGEVDEDMLQRLKAGVLLDDGPAQFSDIQKAPGGEGLNHWYHCVVMEGRNREVRRLWESQGLVVSRLKRVRYGPVFLNAELSMGRWREMTQAEVDILSQEVGLKPVPLPEVKAKFRDRLERLQRKSPGPVGTARRGSKEPGDNHKSKPATRPSRERPASGRAPQPRRGQEAPPGVDAGGQRGKPKPRPRAVPQRRPEATGEGQRPGFKRGRRP